MEWPGSPPEQSSNQDEFYMRAMNLANSNSVPEYGFGDAGRRSHNYFGESNTRTSMPQTIAAEARNDYRKIFEWAAVHSKEFVPAALRAQRSRAASRPENRLPIAAMSDRDYFEQMSKDNQIPNFPNFQIDSPKIELTPSSKGSSPPPATQKTIAQLFKEAVWARAQGHETNYHVLYHEDGPDELSFKGFKKQTNFPEDVNTSDSGTFGSDSGSSDTTTWLCSDLRKSHPKSSASKNVSSTPKTKNEAQEKKIPMTKYKRFGVRR